MDWNRIKTIFIISFLILDLFLLRQFFSKVNGDQFTVMTESTIEQDLEANGIKYPTLPEVEKNVPTITGTSKQITAEAIAKLKNQTAKVMSDNKLHSTFTTPILVDFKEGNYDKFLNAISEGNQYKYWRRNKELQVVYFTQVVDNKLIFNNSSSIVKAHYNSKDEITHYEQSILGSIQKMDNTDEKGEVISATKAIESLFVNNVLKPNSVVNKISLGYYKLVTLSSSIEVLVPTWCFIVNDTEQYYVNGLEGQIIDSYQKSTEIETKEVDEIMNENIVE